MRDKNQLAKKKINFYSSLRFYIPKKHTAIMPSYSQDNRQITFVVATKYHIIISYVIQNFFPRDYRKYIVISDVMTDAEDIYKKLVALNTWDKVFLIENKELTSTKKFFFAKMSKFLRAKLQIERLIKRNNMQKICVFTHGDYCSRFFSSSSFPKEIYLGEDGTFPYYGGYEMYDSYKNFEFLPFSIGNIKQEINSLLELIKKGKSFLLHKLSPSFFVVDHSKRVKAMILLRPDLYNDNFDQQKKDIYKVDCNSEQINKSFKELSEVFDYVPNEIYDNADVVFFESGIVREELNLSTKEQVKFTLDLLTKFKNKKVIIKLGPYASTFKTNSYKLLSKDMPNIFIDDTNTNIPWEIIYYNNKDSFKDLIISSYRSTACFSTYLLFGIENDVVVFSKILLNKFKMPSEDEIYAKLYSQFIDKLKFIYTKKTVFIPSKVSSLDKL